MQRRKAIATAGAIMMTAASAVLAAGANLGAFGTSGGSAVTPPRVVSRKAGAPVVVTKTIQIPVADSSSGGSGDAGGPTEAEPAHGVVGPTTPTSEEPEQITTTVPQRGDDSAGDDSAGDGSGSAHPDDSHPTTPGNGGPSARSPGDD